MVHKLQRQVSQFSREHQVLTPLLVIVLGLGCFIAGSMLLAS